MSKSVKLKIIAKGEETDAPTVTDFVEQTRDYFTLIGSVEAATGVKGEVVWRITHAQKASPLELEATAFPRQHAMHIDSKVEQILETTEQGLRQIIERGERPAYFGDDAIKATRRIMERVQNGLSGTSLVLTGRGELVINENIAAKALSNLREILPPLEAPSPWKELGSVEGRLLSAASTKEHRPVFRILESLSGKIVDCYPTTEAVETWGGVTSLAEVWASKRVIVTGIVHFRAPGQIDRIEAHKVEVLPSDEGLPDLADIQDDDFTDGLGAVEYLERFWNGNLS